MDVYTYHLYQVTYRVVLFIAASLSCCDPPARCVSSYISRYIKASYCEGNVTGQSQSYRVIRIRAYQLFHIMTGTDSWFLSE
jgi:hypothetical protein